MRYCKDIGMFAIDRPAKSCVHATQFCRENCFNLKFYMIYPAMRPCDKRLASEWVGMTGVAVQTELARKRHQTERARLMTRGESFATMMDIAKVEGICRANPDTMWWAPTRAWRNRRFMLALERMAKRTPNIKLQASTDPTTTRREWKMLKRRGWSTMFFGDDTMETTPNGDPVVKCAKTWNHENGACATCTVGCFADHRTDVHLKQH